MPAPVDGRPQAGDALAAPLATSAATRSGGRPTPTPTPVDALSKAREVAAQAILAEFTDISAFKSPDVQLIRRAATAGALSALQLSASGAGEPVAWRYEYRDDYKGVETPWHFRYSSTQPRPGPANAKYVRNVEPLYLSAPPEVSPEAVAEGGEALERAERRLAALTHWAFNHVDTLLLYVRDDCANDTHVRAAVAFAKLIAPERKLRMAHLKGAGWHPADAQLRDVGLQPHPERNERRAMQFVRKLAAAPKGAWPQNSDRDFLSNTIQEWLAEARHIAALASPVARDASQGDVREALERIVAEYRKGPSSAVDVMFQIASDALASPVERPRDGVEPRHVRAVIAARRYVYEEHKHGCRIAANRKAGRDENEGTSRDMIDLALADMMQFGTGDFDDAIRALSTAPQAGDQG